MMQRFALMGPLSHGAMGLWWDYSLVLGGKRAGARAASSIVSARRWEAGGRTPDLRGERSGTATLWVATHLMFCDHYAGR